MSILSICTFDIIKDFLFETLSSLGFEDIIFFWQLLSFFY